MSFSLSLVSCSQTAKNQLLSFCKKSGDSLTVRYLDSAHGIENVQKTTVDDTLVLTVFVSETARQDDVIIQVPSGVTIVMVGDRTIELNQIPHCAKTYRGKAALDILSDGNQAAPESNQP